MSQVTEMKSYLVGLGFKVDAQSYREFDSTLVNAARSVKAQTTAIGGDLLKWQIGIVGFFTTVSGAILSTISKVAQADQEYRLLGERMFTSTQNAREMKIALDALGQPMEAIAFDPELHERYMQLRKDQKELSAGLGGDFKSQMREARDVEFELTRMKVEFQYFIMGFAKDLSKALFGDGDVLKHLREINSWIIKNIPMWAQEFTDYVLPVLNDTWRIVKDIGYLLGTLGVEFTNIIATISGDDSIKTSTFDFEKFAKAVEKVVHEVEDLLDRLIKLETHHPVLETLAGMSVGGAVGTVAGGVIGSVVPGAGTVAGAAMGGTAGTIIGGYGAAILGYAGRANAGPAGGGDTSIDAIRAAAKIAAAKLGVDPSIIFAQWAHETNDFKDYKAKDFNNFGGVRPAGKNTGWQHFDSPNAFAEYYAGMIQRKYKGSVGAKNSDDYVKGLHIGELNNYDPTSTMDAYQRAVRSHINDYSGGGHASTTHISVGDIHVTQPNATNSDVANVVAQKIAYAQQRSNQRNLAQQTTVFA